MSFYWFAIVRVVLKRGLNVDTCRIFICHDWISGSNIISDVKKLPKIVFFWSVDFILKYFLVFWDDKCAGKVTKRRYLEHIQT